MKQKGVLVVISGFSGAGKGTLVKGLLAKYDNYVLSISSTTREPRNNEVHGQEYFFTNRDVFDKMIDQNELIEWAEYVGNYYGTPKKYVEDKLAQGEDVILEIETIGAFQIRDQYPDALLIFITSPTVLELKKRLEKRGTEAPQKIYSRLQKGIKEINEMNRYDYVVVNDNVDRCVELIHQMIQIEHFKASRSHILIERLRNEFDDILKGDQ